MNSAKSLAKNLRFSPDWILYQDEDIVVANKPSGLLSVPGRLSDPSFCLVGQFPKELQNSLIVHRLDMDTSGIMVLAKHKDAHRHLSNQFQNRQTAKTYHALIKGIPSSLQGSTHLPMRCDWEQRPLQMIDFTHGKAATTQWDVAHTYYQANTQTAFSLISLTPITGRSHQLRLHMKMLGHPILGDNLYADLASFKMSNRLCLHATELCITHPRTQEALKFQHPIDLLLEVP